MYQNAKRFNMSMVYSNLDQKSKYVPKIEQLEEWQNENQFQKDNFETTREKRGENMRFSGVNILDDFKEFPELS